MGIPRTRRGRGETAEKWGIPRGRNGVVRVRKVRSPPYESLHVQKSHGVSGRVKPVSIRERRRRPLEGMKELVGERGSRTTLD